MSYSLPESVRFTSVCVHSSKDKHQTLVQLIFYFRYFDSTRMGVVVGRHFLGHAMEVVERSITDTLERVELVGHAMEV